MNISNSYVRVCVVCVVSTPNNLRCYATPRGGGGFGGFFGLSAEMNSTLKEEE